ncbi:MAG TPA: hypothetical protein VHE14_09475 [Solirubrobacteraceae bacterium]|nr:hypothetical protein [Solirubrobacteraceae bacterium]
MIAKGLLSGAVALLLTALVAAPAPAARKRPRTKRPPTVHVKIGDDYFVHDQIGAVVKAVRGAKVTWDWTGMDPHHLKAISGPGNIESPTLSSGSWSQRVKKPGTYTIVCTIHGAAVMSMTLKVR